MGEESGPVPEECVVYDAMVVALLENRVADVPILVEGIEDIGAARRVLAYAAGAMSAALEAIANDKGFDAKYAADLVKGFILEQEAERT